jgi:hypothetical protein
MSELAGNPTQIFLIWQPGSICMSLYIRRVNIPNNLFIINEALFIGAFFVVWSAGVLKSTIQMYNEKDAETNS